MSSLTKEYYTHSICSFLHKPFSIASTSGPKKSGDEVRNQQLSVAQATWEKGHGMSEVFIGFDPHQIFALDLFIRLLFFFNSICSLYIYICICNMYMCIYMYIYIYMYKFIYVYIFTCVIMYMHMYIYIYIKGFTSQQPVNWLHDLHDLSWESFDKSEDILLISCKARDVGSAWIHWILPIESGKKKGRTVVLGYHGIPK